MDKSLPRRTSPRLKNYDYNSPGKYFITFCTHEKRPLLSQIVGAIHESPESILTHAGMITEKALSTLPNHLPARIDSYVIMPNHVHLILTISDTPEQRAIRESPLRKRSALSKTVGYIKMNITKQIHSQSGPGPIWQRGYYDHVIRDEKDYLRIVTYMEQNPFRWSEDRFYEPE